MKKFIKNTIMLAVVKLGLAYVINTLLNHDNERYEVLKGDKDFFQSSFGNIKYETYGNPNGKPLLFLHSIDLGSSSMDFDDFAELGIYYKIYTLDFLGFGLSDKPNISYSSYLYTSIINQFISEVIQDSAVVVTNENSYAYALKAYLLNNQNIEKFIFIDPEIDNNYSKCFFVPKCVKFILEQTFIGDFLYNLATSNNIVSKVFVSKVFGKNIKNYSMLKTGGASKSVALYNYYFNDLDVNVYSDLENIDIETVIVTTFYDAYNNDNILELVHCNKNISYIIDENDTNEDRYIKTDELIQIILKNA